MTREEEVETCIATLKNRVHSYTKRIKNHNGLDEILKVDCENTIIELQDLIKYIDESINLTIS